ncbi:hypothetical protein TrispH2_012011, partial [Trichoplax sp. H2]
MTDFDWMTRKIQIDRTIYYLDCDLTNYIDYLKKRNKKPLLTPPGIDELITLLFTFSVTCTAEYKVAIRHHYVAEEIEAENKLNWEDFDQLKQLLKQQQPCLDVVDRDVIQMILWVDMSDSWMKQRALQLAKENVRNGESYWSMS